MNPISYLLYTCVRRYKQIKVYDVWEKEYGYVGRTRERYQAIVEVTQLFGITICRKTLDQEHVPNYALIELGATGTTVWQSKFKDWL